MSLTEGAIQELERVVITASAVDTRNIDSADYKAVIIPDDCRIQTLEQLQTHRNRFKGKMATDNIQSFYDYSVCMSNGNDSVKCFVASSGTSAKTIFNIGDTDKPGHCDNTARLYLPETAEFKAVLAINERKLTQRQFAEWIEDWQFNLLARDYFGEYIDIKKVIGSIRRVSIESLKNADHEVGDYAASKSTFEKVEAKNQETLPRELLFTAIPYVGLTSRCFSLRISLITSGDEPVFSIRIVKLEAIKEEIREEFRALLANKFENTSIKTFIGDFDI